jgi:glycosyltransferase involved in cell wall biosynthesis
MQIVEDLQKSHSQGSLIRILRHPQNRGIGEARNTIISQAKGKYLFFIDSDDYIELYTIDILLKEAETHYTDCVFASCRRVDYITNEELPTFTYTSRLEFFGKDVFANYVCQDLRWHVGINVWNILFRLDFLKDGKFKFAARKDEDAVFLSDFYSEVERAIILPNVTYYYVSRPGSIMGNMARNQIPTKEIRERFMADAVMTNHCARLKDRSFYDVHCARVVKHKFRAVCVALRHRHRFTEPLSSKEIRQELKHPATMAEILKFKRYKTFHILFYMISVLPSFLSVGISYVIGKMMKWI